MLPSQLVATRPVRSVLLCVAVALALSSRAARADSYGFTDESWEGVSELVRLARKTLGPNRVVTADVLDWSTLRPEDGVLVLHPERDLDYVQTSSFLRAGGRLALLDDLGRGESLLNRFEIHRVDAPRNAAQTLRDNPHLIVAVPAVQLVAGQEQGRHPMVASVGQLVTNHPTGLAHPNLTTVLTMRATGEPDVTLAVTGIIAEKGRLFCMGDPSALINLMLRYPGNRAFALGLVEYLVEDDSWGPRGGKVYVVANAFTTRGSFGDESTLARRIQDQADNLQDQLVGIHRDGLPSIAALLLAALVSLAAIWWTMSTSSRLYRRVGPRYARPTHLVVQGGLAGRAALLAAPTTNRALALLELKNALEEGLALRLGLPSGARPSQILAEIDRQQALSRSSSALLRQTIEELRRAETAVVNSQTLRATTNMVNRIKNQVESLLVEVDQHVRRKP